MFKNFILPKSLLFLITLMAVSLGCSNKNDSCRPDTPEIDPLTPALSVTRLEQGIFSAKQPSDIQKLLKENELIAQRFFRTNEYPEDSIVSMLWKLRQSPYLDTLNQETQTVYTDFSKQKEELSQLFAYLKYYYPKQEVPNVYTLISGFGTDIFFDGNKCLLIGLDCWLGGKTRYKIPVQQTPMYIQARMSPAHLAPSIALLFSKDKVKIDELDNTLIAQMVQWGKTYYLMEKILPCTNDSLLIGYNPKQMNAVSKNIDKIWGYFVKRNLFYESQPYEVNRYIGERPKTPEIAEQCPGRIGRYLGWQIVRAYASSHPELSIQEILQETDAKKIFTQSNFKPTPANS